MEWPSLDRPAIDVARTNRNVSAVVQGSNHLRNDCWIVREVGIHREDFMEVVCECVIETREICGPQSFLADAMNDRKACVVCSEAFDNASGAVWAQIVDYNDRQPWVVGPNMPKETLDVLAFVVRRKHEDARAGAIVVHTSIVGP